MTEAEQITAFEADLKKLVRRYVKEFSLTTASAIGVLQMEIITIHRDAVDADEEDEL